MQESQEISNALLIRDRTCGLEDLHELASYIPLTDRQLPYPLGQRRQIVVERLHVHCFMGVQILQEHLQTLLEMRTIPCDHQLPAGPCGPGETRTYTSAVQSRLIHMDRDGEGHSNVFSTVQQAINHSR